MRRAIFLLALAAATGPGVVRANPFDLYGLGARGAALSGALTGAEADVGALYYNPASIVGRSSFLHCA